MSVTSFWDLLQAYRDESGASEAWVLRRAELNKGTFSAWRARGIPTLPSQVDLLALSEAIRVDYEVLLNAILHDVSYLPARAAASVAEDQRKAAALEEARTTIAWGRIAEIASQALADHHGDRDAARASLLAKDARKKDRSNDTFNAAMLLSDGPGKVRLPSRLAHLLSVPSDRISDLVAADEQEQSISGEQGQDPHP